MFKNLLFTLIISLNSFLFSSSIETSKQIKINLTQEELSYLKGKKILNICTRFNHYPLSYYKNGEAAGYSGDVLNLIFKDTNIKFNIIPSNSNEEFKKNIESNKCEIISIINKDLKFFENYLVSETILNQKFSAVANIDVPFVDTLSKELKKVFYVKESTHKNIFSNIYPMLNVKIVEDIDKIIKIIEKDKNAAFVVPTFTTEYIIQKYGPHKFKVIDTFDKTEISAGIGVNKNEPLLLDIINKSLKTIGENKLEEIQSNYRIHEYKIVKSYTKELLFILFFMIVILLILYKKNKDIEYEKNKFKQIIDNSVDNIHILNRDGIIVQASKSFAKSLGYSQSDLIGMHVSQWDWDMSNIDDHLKEIFESSMKFFTKHKRKDGKVFDVQVHTSPISLNNQIFLYASSKDISDTLELRKIKNLQLKQKELIESLNAAQEIAKIGSFTHYLKSDRFETSLEYRKIHGVDQAYEVTLDDIIKIIHFEDKEDLLNKIELAQQFGKELGTEYRIIVNGEIKYIKARWSFEFDEDNIVDKVNGITIDITKEILDKEEKNNKDIMILEQAKMASLGEMIANIAHQWRQPLTTISSVVARINVEMKLKKLSATNLENHTKKISDNVLYLSDVIDTFRNFIKEKNILKEIKVYKLIENSLTIIKDSLTDSHIKIVNNININNANIKVNIKANEFTQVIINILNNAKDIILEKKIDNGSVIIDIIEEKEKVIITIEDNAGGIPENILPKIFEPYFTTKHKAQGTGLGLHMSYKLVKESLNGELYARNSEKGAVFYIEIPLSS